MRYVSRPLVYTLQPQSVDVCDAESVVVETNATDSLPNEVGDEARSVLVLEPVDDDILGTREGESLERLVDCPSTAVLFL